MGSRVGVANAIGVFVGKIVGGAVGIGDVEVSVGKIGGVAVDKDDGMTAAAIDVNFASAVCVALIGVSAAPMVPRYPK